MDIKKMKICCFIFARGGSKGVPGKNIRLLGGKPLLAHAIETARQCGIFDRIIVSTDDEKIVNVAKKYGAEVPFIRPLELAQDGSPEWLAWQHAVKFVSDFDLFVSLPATAPLRSPKDIENCVETFIKTECDVVVTCKKTSRHPSFNMIQEDDKGCAHLVIPTSKTVCRRQEVPVVYDMTTVAYVLRPEFILSKNNIFEGKIKAVVVPEERALDIDTELDFEFAEFLFQKKQDTKSEDEKC
jgi:N-acylneuraminate cytidylyltransferase